MRSVNRRTILRAGIVLSGGTIMAACSGDSPAEKKFVKPDSRRVAEAEAAREPGRVREFQLKPTASKIDLGGVTVNTWTYGGKLPGKEIRLSRGEQLKAVVDNELDAPTSVHWHGLALRNDADGVPGVTQPDIEAGASYTYQFTVPHAGTYWFHPHTGVQQDRGLYAPLIVEDPDEAGDYDEEWVVVLDDWMDGVTGTPDEVLAELSKGMGEMDHGSGHDSEGPTAMGHMLMGAQSDLLGGDAGDVAYPHFLINGKIPADPETLKAKPGTRVRIRLINAAGDTAFRVALGGHRMRVTHTDGFACEAKETDALLLGMGERYDVVVELGDGVFPLVAAAEGKDALARALVRTGSGDVPAADKRPNELDGTILAYSDLDPAESVRLKKSKPDRTVDLELTGGMADYDWAINGKPYDHDELYGIDEGER
ncbi:MAG: multicopper oxidase family protein, partial [Stackebrandtia sp.]